MRFTVLTVLISALAATCFAAPISVADLSALKLAPVPQHPEVPSGPADLTRRGIFSKIGKLFKGKKAQAPAPAPAPQKVDSFKLPELPEHKKPLATIPERVTLGDLFKQTDP